MGIEASALYFCLHHRGDNKYMVGYGKKVKKLISFISAKENYLQAI